MGYSLVGMIDENNVITITGFVPDGEYAIKYEKADGSTIDIGDLTLGANNLFVIGGDGYIMNGRCSSGGADRTDSNGIIVSNYIKVSNGDTIYMNKPIATQSQLYSGMKLTDGSVKGFLSNNTSFISNLSTANGITRFTVSNANADYIRISIDLSYGTALTDADVKNAGVIITVNEPLA